MFDTKRTRNNKSTICIAVCVVAVFGILVHWISLIYPSISFTEAELRKNLRSIRFRRTLAGVEIRHPKFPIADNLPFDESESESTDLHVDVDSEKIPIKSRREIKVKKKRRKRFVSDFHTLKIPNQNQYTKGVRATSATSEEIKSFGLGENFKININLPKKPLSVKKLDSATILSTADISIYKTNESKLRTKRQMLQNVNKKKDSDPDGTSDSVHVSTITVKHTEKQKESRILVPSWFSSLFRGNEVKNVSENTVATNHSSLNSQISFQENITANTNQNFSILTGFKECDNCDFEVEFNAIELSNNSLNAASEKFTEKQKEERNAIGQVPNQSAQFHFSESIVKTSTLDYQTDSEEETSISLQPNPFNENSEHLKTTSIGDDPGSYTITSSSLFSAGPKNNLNVSSDAFASGESFSDTFTATLESQKEDWLLNYCFQKLLSHDFGNESSTTSTQTDLSDSVLKNNFSRGLEDFDGLLEQLSERKLAETLDSRLDFKTQSPTEFENQHSKKSERGSRLLKPLFNFFDFFGSGNAGRMIGENAEKIAFDDAIKNPPVEQFDDLKFAGAECLKFFQSMLREQTRIAKPNLIDILTALKIEIADSSLLNSTISQDIRTDSGNTLHSESFAGSDDEFTTIQNLIARISTVNVEIASEVQTQLSSPALEFDSIEHELIENFDGLATSTREGKFLSIFGFGSGESAVESNGFQRKKNFGERRFLGSFFNFGSGAGQDEMSVEPSIVEKGKHRRFWSIFDASSGDGRQLPTANELGAETTEQHPNFQDLSNCNDCDIDLMQVNSENLENATAVQTVVGIFKNLSDDDFRYKSERRASVISLSSVNLTGITDTNIQSNASDYKIDNTVVDISYNKDVKVPFLSENYISDTEGQNFGKVEGRFFGDLFGAGSGESRNFNFNPTENELYSVNSETYEGRFLGNFFSFGSGDRSFEKSANAFTEITTSSVPAEKGANETRRFFFIPDFGSGEIIFEPQEENSPKPSTAADERRFLSNFFDVGSGESRSFDGSNDTESRLNQEDSIKEVLENNVTNEREISSYQISNSTSAQFKALNDTRGTGVRTHNSSRSSRLHEETQIECNNMECSYEYDTDNINVSGNSKSEVKEFNEYFNCDSPNQTKTIFRSEADKPNTDKSILNTKSFEEKNTKTSEEHDHSKHTVAIYDRDNLNTKNGPTSTPSNVVEKFCVHVGHCNNSLNERCVLKENYHVCGCGKSFVRHPHTKKCEAKFMLETSLRFPKERYSDDLKNPYSLKYEQKMKDAKNMMQLLLDDNPELAANVAEFKVTGFASGSLIVNWTIVMVASNNETLQHLSQHFDQAIRETLRHKDILDKAPLNAENVSILSISLADIDPCVTSDLNYCSKFAECIRERRRPGGFLCRCKEGNLDFSMDREHHPGEVCQVSCSLKYCGSHGSCRVNQGGDRECFCRGWYLGKRCQISGVSLSISIAAAIFTAGVIIFACIYWIRIKWPRSQHERQRSSFVRTYDFLFDGSGHETRVDDIVALSEGLSLPEKFNKISLTPSLPPDKILPSIQVIPPSVSDISYSVDSSFDTPPGMSNRFSASSNTSEAV